MIKTECCAFCGKELSDLDKVEINGEHIFPAFMCKRNYGNSESSRSLQEKIKVSVCKDCNSKYGERLETNLSKIINGLNGKTPRYSFRTEEALCLLDYIDKTRILLQHSFRDDRQRGLLNGVNVSNLSHVSPFGREVFILRANVPDGVYFPVYSTVDNKIFKTKLGYVSSINPGDFVSTIAVCIDNIAIIGISNLWINMQLGFPRVRVLPNANDQLGYVEGTHWVDADGLWQVISLQENDTILLAQPGILPKGMSECSIIGDYEKSHELTTKHDNYAYAVYFASGNNNGWLAKNSTESGAKGIKFNIEKYHSYYEFLKILDALSKVDMIMHVSSIEQLLKKYAQEWENMCHEILSLKFKYTNIIATSLTFKHDFIENLQKIRGFNDAKTLINKLNLLAQDESDLKELLSTLRDIERK